MAPISGAGFWSVCRWLKTGVMWSWRRVAETNRAAAFWRTGDVQYEHHYASK